MNEINALIWPTQAGIGIMDKAAYARTAKIAKQFGAIKKPPAAAPTATDLAKAAVAQLKAQGVDVQRQEAGRRRRQGHARAASSDDSEAERRETRDVRTDQRRPHHHRGGRLRRRRLRRGRADLPDRRVARPPGRPGDRRSREVRASRLRRPAHASRHAVRRHGHDRRRRVGADRGGVRRHDVPRRLHHPAAGLVVRRRDRRLAREGERQAGDRHGLPHGGHRSPRRAARSRSSPRCPTRASPRTSSSWRTRAR